MFLARYFLWALVCEFFTFLVVFFVQTKSIWWLTNIWYIMARTICFECSDDCSETGGEASGGRDHTGARRRRSDDNRHADEQYSARVSEHAAAAAVAAWEACESKSTKSPLMKTKRVDVNAEKQFFFWTAWRDNLNSEWKNKWADGRVITMKLFVNQSEKRNT